MSSSPSKFLRSQYSDLTSHEVTSQPANVLLGVSDAAKMALATIGINTVFDLAFSSVFANATKIVEMAGNQVNGSGWIGQIPGDVVNEAARVIPIDELPSASIRIFSAVGVVYRSFCKSWRPAG